MEELLSFLIISLLVFVGIPLLVVALLLFRALFEDAFDWLLWLVKQDDEAIYGKSVGYRWDWIANEYRRE